MKPIYLSRPQLGPLEADAVRHVMLSGQIAQGPVVEEFEKKFARYMKMAYGVATSSGTTALHTVLLAAGIGKGDEVITTPFTFIATINAILWVGAVPVFVDINPYTFNIDASLIEEAITERTRAILPVHLFGCPCDMDQIMALAGKYSLKVIEDCCQSHGAKIGDTYVGGYGHASVFSFYPSKNMTTGEGGMILTCDYELYDTAKLIRQHGSSGAYHHKMMGYNYRMTDIQAAIGLVQLTRLDEFNRKRIENVGFYSTHLKNSLILPFAPVLPFVPEKYTHVFNQYTLLVAHRPAVVKKLTELHIPVGVYYPTLVYKYPVYGDRWSRLRHPRADNVCGMVMSLPVHPGMEEDQLSYISNTLNEVKL